MTTREPAYIVGLDGGGTKTDAVVADFGGNVHGVGVAAACNVAAMPVADAFMAARDACRIAMDEAGITPVDVAVVCAGVAGASHVRGAAEFGRAVSAMFPRAKIAVEADYAVALAGGTGGRPGIVIIAGTGSVAYGEDGSGRGFRAGGYGHLIDDDGSGYGVGRRAINAVLKASDGSGPPTSLTPALLEALSLEYVAEIVPGVYSGPIDRVRIASLAAVVARIAEDGDGVARAILNYTGGALGRLVAAVAQELFSGATDPYSIVTTGSLWHAGPALTDVFRRSVHRFAPCADITTPLETPVHGAVRRAIAQRRS